MNQKCVKKIDNSKLALVGPFKLECLLMRMSQIYALSINDLLIYPYFKSNFVQDAPTIYYIVLYSYVPVFFTLNKVRLLSEVIPLPTIFSGSSR